LQPTTASQSIQEAKGRILIEKQTCIKNFMLRTQKHGSLPEFQENFQRRKVKNGGKVREGKR
jgi:hypothetical protein